MAKKKNKITFMFSKGSGGHREGRDLPESPAECACGAGGGQAHHTRVIGFNNGTEWENPALGTRRAVWLRHIKWGQAQKSRLN
jgi:hypothetical protein